ncbi:serine/threonine-protein kinase [Prevotella sp. kh1p2]|uniref:serine/threonine-protein kinase n=1 Tax=Prevotella sp. kh1p2 TaxID=1761883 RepID=UPI0008C01189|nr:serine/threonine-protein kinase [Prevotella sp. kh1p2]SET05557.1 serine/threonine protein kinase [Prevotella sp. kh1p2]SNU11783.1 serine/threonine protein kinase [Prevotellaceae bacterium KH2P17]
MEYTNFSLMAASGIYRVMKAQTDDQPVVMKGLRQEYRERGQYQNLLKKEFEQGQKLDSPYIIKYKEFVDLPEYGKCIVEEYVDGRSLADYLKENLSDDEKLAVVVQIAEGLRYIHEKNIVHRNLKPSNVLITKQGNRVKLIDFRMAYANDLQVPFKAPKYVAPELKDETLSIDGRSDIYSLGVIMKDMGLPKFYDAIIDKCCSYSRTDRYMGVDALLDALNSDQSRGGLSARWILLAACLLAVVVGLVYWFTTKDGKKPEEMQQTEIVDSVQTAPKEQVKPAPKAATAPVAPVNPKMAFLEQVRTQMFADIDHIYQPYITAAQSGNAVDQRGLRKRIKSYYLGILETFGKIDSEQREAFDKVFAEYNQRKSQELQSYMK